jgi:hypothetical protein
MSDGERPADPLLLVRRAARKLWPWCAGATVVLVAAGVVFRHQFHWGDVPTWLMAVTTLLALAAAVFAGMVAYALLSIEDERDLKGRRDQAEEQARKVAAWYDTWEAPPLFGPDAPRPALEPEVVQGARISNASDLPVYHVRVSFCVPVDPWQDWREGVRYTPPKVRTVLPPGNETQELPDDVREQHQQSTAEWQVVIEFTDAAGKVWRRDAQGRLLTPPPVNFQKASQEMRRRAAGRFPFKRLRGGGT